MRKSKRAGSRRLFGEMDSPAGAPFAFRSIVDTTNDVTAGRMACRAGYCTVGASLRP